MICITFYLPGFETNDLAPAGLSIAMNKCQLHGRVVFFSAWENFEAADIIARYAEVGVGVFFEIKRQARNVQAPPAFFYFANVAYVVSQRFVQLSFEEHRFVRHFEIIDFTSVPGLGGPFGFLHHELPNAFTRLDI